MNIDVTERLLLRPPGMDDLERFFAIHSDPATNRFNPAGPLKEREEACNRLCAWIRHWQEHGYGQWAVATQDAPEHVIGFGGISLRDYLGNERVNLGYRFHVAAWGDGYASELGRASLRVAHDELQLPEVFGLVRPGHIASIRVLEKIGMKQTGTLDDVPGAEHSLIYRSARI